MRKKIKVKRKPRQRLNNNKSFIREIRDYMSSMKVYRILMKTKKIGFKESNTTLCNYSIIM
jgi:hypothetical protein